MKNRGEIHLNILERQIDKRKTDKATFERIETGKTMKEKLNNKNMKEKKMLKRQKRQMKRKRKNKCEHVFSESVKKYKFLV